MPLTAMNDGDDDDNNEVEERFIQITIYFVDHFSFEHSFSSSCFLLFFWLVATISHFIGTGKYNKSKSLLQRDKVNALSLVSFLFFLQVFFFDSNSPMNVNYRSSTYFIDFFFFSNKKSRRRRDKSKMRKKKCWH